MASRLKGGQAQDFSAGPNLRDAAPKLATNESSDAWNATFDERGDVASRLGYEKDGAAYPALIVNEFYSALLSKKVVFCADKKLYLDTDKVTSVNTFTTADCVTFAELNSLVIACHPVDGIFTSSDGITWTVVADADAPTKPLCCATWQGRLYIGLAGGKLQWSNFSTPTAWTATDFNNLWEVDQHDIVNLHVASGQDIIGQAGLVAFKQDSSYLVFDASTGDYSTLDATVGAAGPKAVVGVGAKVIAVSKRGICSWQQGQVGFKNDSDRLFPLWNSGQLNFGQQQKWCAGRKLNRAYFSLTRAGATVNDLALEFHPDQDWIAPRSDAMACYTTSTGNTEVLYGGSPTVTGQNYILDSTGADDGVAITGRFQTRWFQLNDGFNSSLWQIRLHGRGTGTMVFRTNYASASGDEYAFDLTGQSGTTYDTGLLYDSGETYVIPAYQQTQALFGFDLCREFSLLFEFTADSTVSAPQVFGSGTAPQVGEFGLSSIEWLYTPLGLS